MAKEYKTLDDAIAHSHEYLEQRERTIGKLTEVYRHAASPSTRYELAYQLYDAYRPYCSDSALYYIQQCIQLAEASGGGVGLRSAVPRWLISAPRWVCIPRP